GLGQFRVECDCSLRGFMRALPDLTRIDIRMDAERRIGGGEPGPSARVLRIDRDRTLEVVDGGHEALIALRPRELAFQVERVRVDALGRLARDPARLDR